MSIASNVVWSEGMFITPQHLQHNDKHVKSYIASFFANHSEGHGYGLGHFEWDRSLLNLGKLCWSNISGVFPDGTCFEEPGQVIRDVPPESTNRVVYLALPLLSEGKVSFGEQAQNFRYHTFTKPLFDMTCESLDSCDTELSSTNLQIKFEGEDLSGYSVIPMTKILQVNKNAEVVLDKGFMPTSLQLQASKYLQLKLQETLLLLTHNNRQVATKLQSRQHHQSEQSMMMDVLQLQTLNRWHTELSLSMSTLTTPLLSLYRQLSAFSAELNALQMQGAGKVTALNPQHMYLGFSQVFANLKKQLSLVKKTGVSSLSWDYSLFEQRRIVRVQLTEHHKIRNHRFVLGIKSALGREKLSQLVPKTCRLAGLNQLGEVIKNGQSGVELNYLPLAPSGLSQRSDMAFFEICTEHHLWQNLFELRETIALHIDSRIDEPECYLHILGG